jgi:DNA-binding transcriptional regulator YdaS (Cro superfamily)
MTELKRYLKENGKKSSWFAEKIGVSVTRLGQIANHGAHPSLATAVRIEQVTEGQIRANDLINNDRNAFVKNRSKTRKDTPETFKKNAEYMIKQASRQILKTAINNGFIIVPSHCGICRLEKKLSAYHPDYTKPTCVQWLCCKCHKNMQNRTPSKQEM